MWGCRSSSEGNLSHKAPREERVASFHLLISRVGESLAPFLFPSPLKRDRIEIPLGTSHLQHNQKSRRVVEGGVVQGRLSVKQRQYSVSGPQS